MSALDKHAALIRKFFERRNVQLFEGIRHERSAIAARMAADGTVNSGGFVVAVTRAYVAGFEEFAGGLIEDTFGLMKASGFYIDNDLAQWITQQLEPLISAAARNVCGEASEGAVLRKELQENVERAMDVSLARTKRDLGINLERATLEKGQVSEVVDEALVDPLVRLQNRRGLEREFGQRTTDPNEPLSLILFDIDHFKEVNDKHGGHATGDEALVSIATTAAACVKGKGRAFRLGGDEFVLMLPNHSLEEGLALAERFRVAVSSVARTSRELSLSVSVGVAVWPTDGSDLEMLVKAADRALYDAKELGRNLVRASGEPSARRIPPKPTPTIKWVDLEYPARSGLQARLNAEGLKLTWRRDDRPRDDDAEPVTVDDAGQLVMFKVNSEDSPLTLYQKRQ